MKTISRYIMTLALLITAVTGAWADSFSTEAYTADATLSAVSVTENTTLTINTGVTVTVNNGLTINSGATLTVTGGGSLAVNGATGAEGPDGNTDEAEGSPAIAGSGQLAIANATITATGGAGGNGGYDEYCSAFGGDGAPAVSGVSISIQTGSLTAIGGAGGIGGTSTVYNLKYDDGATANAFSSFPNISDATLSYSTDNVTYTKYESGNTKLYRYMKIEPLDGPKVTTNAASEQDLFTEASFEMPQSDVTVNYELVRDMSIEMTATMGDGTDGYRIRIKKDNQTGKFVPAEMNLQAMAGLITVTDDIEEKTLTNVTDYTVSIFAVDGDNNPTGDAIAFADLVPGRYVAIATAADGSAYDGATEQSNVFVLFQGYEVEVAAKEFITYYKDEPLYADTETSADAELYTITSVSADQATLSAAIETAPSLTPLLIFNNSDQAKTFLLIPANEEPNLQLIVAPEFQGTLTGTTIAASTDTQTNYALNGKAFVFVKNAIEVGPNKAWLSINNSNARALTIVFSDATGISTTNYTNLTNGDWYDLNGRKLQAVPTKKGVYIQNGKKVVIK